MIIIQKHGISRQYCRDQPDLAADNTITNFTEANVITDLFKIKEKITGQRDNSGTKKMLKYWHH